VHEGDERWILLVQAAEPPRIDDQPPDGPAGLRRSVAGLAAVGSTARDMPRPDPLDN